MKTLRIIFISLFILILIIPGIVDLIGWKDKTASFENKAELKKPSFQLDNLDPYPAKYEAWFNTHFPARNSILFLYNYFTARYLHKSPKPEQVTIGNDGWLYLANYEQQVYTGQLRFSEAELRQTMDEINYRKKVCDSLGAEYRIVVIPSKFSIYPEYVPSGIEKYQGLNATDQFIRAIASKSSVKYLDLRPVLREEKKSGMLYMKGDNHWNSRGAFVAYKALINWLRKDYPLTAPLQESDMHFYDTLQTGNIISMLGMDKIWHNTFVKAVPLHPLPQHQAVFPDYKCPDGFGYPWEYLDKRVTADTALPSVLVIRDSFTNIFLREQLSSHFSSSLYVWDKWEHRLNRNIIAGEKPRIVLCVVIESMVDCFKNYPDAPPVQTPVK
ncbi:MAG: hypothetical protein ACHQRM_16395 [Bacteroidia bacterium]